ncbi:SDR family NAD(P)-dependent oxidoreductase [Stakelama saccharophila]|uniref:SDR family oxidoreductase n=1 Tax=Stakelama saccharophila TaxID=3075605 RepID=A0ABZ0BAM4_9SPHN|nr:SDR family oxidoreductase [Stakelama sp. W311]WNO53903.1 SDR family oxidoreductase [Stakelama sp. W311]
MKLSGTALVTGASAGLGVHFARALAAGGHDLILTARRGDRLEALAADLRARHGIAATAIAADLAEAGAVDMLMAGIDRRGLAVDILINNAGFGASGAFAEQDRAMLARMVDCNCRALVELCHAVLPGMIRMRAGAILNLASTAAFQPGPWMSAYYASKAFVLHFSEGLHEEVKQHGVHVSALCPGPTRTDFAAVAGMGDSAPFKHFAADPRAVARDGLKALAANEAVRISGLRNRIMAASARLAPRFAVRRLVASLQRTRLP